MQLSYGTGTARDQYAFDGRRKLYADDVLTPAFFDRSVYYYAELGLTNRLTMGLSVPYKRLVVRDTGFKYAGGAFGDLSLALRYGLEDFLPFLPQGAVLAVNLKGSAPTGYTRNALPAVGDGNVNLAATLDYGMGFFGGAMYSQASAGYRVRTPYYGLSKATPCQPGQDRGCVVDEPLDLGDEFLLRAELGYTPWAPLLFQLIGEAVISAESPAFGFSVDAQKPTHQRYLKTGVGVMVEPVDHLGLSAQAFMTPWGQNTVRSFDLFFGLSTDFSVWN